MDPSRRALLATAAARGVDLDDLDLPTFLDWLLKCLHKSPKVSLKDLQRMAGLGQFMVDDFVDEATLAAYNDDGQKLDDLSRELRRILYRCEQGLSTWKALRPFLQAEGNELCKSTNPMWAPCSVPSLFRKLLVSLCLLPKFVVRGPMCSPRMIEYVKDFWDKICLRVKHCDKFFRVDRKGTIDRRTDVDKARLIAAVVALENAAGCTACFCPDGEIDAWGPCTRVGTLEAVVATLLGTGNEPPQANFGKDGYDFRLWATEVFAGTGIVFAGVAAKGEPWGPGAPGAKVLLRGPLAKEAGLVMANLEFPSESLFDPVDLMFPARVITKHQAQQMLKAIADPDAPLSEVFPARTAGENLRLAVKVLDALEDPPLEYWAIFLGLNPPSEVTKNVLSERLSPADLKRLISSWAAGRITGRPPARDPGSRSVSVHSLVPEAVLDALVRVPAALGYWMSRYDNIWEFIRDFGSVTSGYFYTFSDASKEMFLWLVENFWELAFVRLVPYVFRLLRACVTSTKNRDDTPSAQLAASIAVFLGAAADQLISTETDLSKCWSWSVVPEPNSVDRLTAMVVGRKGITELAEAILAVASSPGGTDQGKAAAFGTFFENFDECKLAQDLGVTRRLIQKAATVCLADYDDFFAFSGRLLVLLWEHLDLARPSAVDVVSMLAASACGGLVAIAGSVANYTPPSHDGGVMIPTDDVQALIYKGTTAYVAGLTEGEFKQLVGLTAHFEYVKDSDDNTEAFKIDVECFCRSLPEFHALVEFLRGYDHRADDTYPWRQAKYEDLALKMRQRGLLIPLATCAHFSLCDPALEFAVHGLAQWAYTDVVKTCGSRASSTPARRATTDSFARYLTSKTDVDPFAGSGLTLDLVERVLHCLYRAALVNLDASSVKNWASKIGLYRGTAAPEPGAALDAVKDALLA